MERATVGFSGSFKINYFEVGQKRKKITFIQRFHKRIHQYKLLDLFASSWLIKHVAAKRVESLFGVNHHGRK
jgi:hypothetical protein